MLELFIRSKIRQRITLLFIHNREKEFYLSEIARKVGTSAGTAQRELGKLMDSDLVIFKKRGGLNVYSLNKNFSLLSEIESIVKKTFGIEAELKKELEKINGIFFAFLFGSYAKGGFKSDSDVDLFVVGNAEEDDIFKAVQKTEDVIGKEINYHMATKADFLKKKKKSYFYRDIANNCILLIGDKNEFRKFIG